MRLGRNRLSLQASKQIAREAPFYDRDRQFAPDIEAVSRLVRAGAFRCFAADLLPSGA